MNFPMTLLLCFFYYLYYFFYLYYFYATSIICYHYVTLPPNLYLPPNLLLVPAMVDMVSKVAGQGARPALRWTTIMSGFVLRRFVDLIGNRVKTDKGFKEIHLNTVSKNVSEFYGQEVTGQQVYNHLRKWRSRWVKVCKLKDNSGALWDEDNFVISLEEGHYAAYINVRTNTFYFSNMLMPLFHFKFSCSNLSC
jgi:hypothetical protein